MFSKFFPKGLFVSLAAVGIAAAIGGVGNVQAHTLFKVTFSHDKIGAAPATAGYQAGTVNKMPTSVGSSSKDSVTVVAKLGGLTHHPVQLKTNNDGGHNKPLIQFGTNVISSGIVKISWESEMTAYTPPTGGQPAENDLTFRLLNGNGVLVGAVGYTYTQAQSSGTKYGGSISLIGMSSVSYAGGADKHWRINGGVDHFVLKLNVDKNDFSLSRNGKPLATGTLGAAAGAGLAYFQIQSGAGIGGYDGKWTAGVDNVKITKHKHTPGKKHKHAGKTK